MKITKPIKIPTSIRLLKEDKQRVQKFTNNFSWYAQLAILEKLDRDEEKLRDEFNQ